MPGIYRLACPAPATVLRRHTNVDPLIERSLHMDRDADAFLQISCALRELDYADTIYDWPGGFFTAEASGDLLAAAGLAPLRALALTKEDLVVVTTRPALDDRRVDAVGESREKRGHVDRSGTPIEARVFDAVKPFFSILKPRQVALDRELDIQDQEGWDHHQHVEFTSRGPTWMKDAPKPKWAAGYAVYEPRWTLPVDGGRIQARLLVAFGMDGSTGLCWAHLLRRKLSRDLQALVRSAEPALLVGEFSFQMAGPDVPLTGDFVRSFECRCTLTRRKRPR
jgi:hypothetical protein